MSQTRPLPPIRGILAVDAEAFSANPSQEQPDLSATIPELLAAAFELAGMPEIWTARIFSQETGDGYFFTVPSGFVPQLIDPFPDMLQNVLLDHDRELMARRRGLRLRLRLSVHLGAVPDGGTGTPIIDTFRLLDSSPVKNALKRSDPDVTLLAAIISHRVFEDAVRAGYTGRLRPAHFEHVTAEIPEKDFVASAWLYVPEATRRQDAPDHAGPRPADPARPEKPSVSNSTTIHGNAGNVISGGTFGGDFHFGGGPAS